MIKLKLCPFCGGESRLETDECDDGLYRIICLDCHATFLEYCEDYEALIQRWNGRFKLEINKAQK